MTTNSEDRPSMGLNFISFLIPLVGLIIYLTQKSTSPIKAKAAGKWALISVIISFVLWLILTVVGVGIMASAY